MRGAGGEKRKFGRAQLREAVDYLRTVDGPNAVLVAEVSTRGTWPDGTVMFRLGAKPQLRLAEIVGLTPRQVWEIFDAHVDEGRKGLARRFWPSYWPAADYSAVLKDPVIEGSFKNDTTGSN